MKNLGSGMDGILKMVLGVLAISGILIMVVSTIDMNGSNASPSANTSAAPSQQANAVPVPVAPGKSSMPADSAVPAPAPGQTAAAGNDEFSASDQEFGSPMMDPSPSSIGGGSSNNKQTSGTSAQSLPAPNNAPSAQPSASSTDNAGGQQPTSSAPTNLPDV